MYYFLLYAQKRGGGAKALNPSLRTYTYMHLKMCDEK